MSYVRMSDLADVGQYGPSPPVDPPFYIKAMDLVCGDTATVTDRIDCGFGVLAGMAVLGLVGLGVGGYAVYRLVKN